MNHRPTLYIGIGGTGCKTLVEIQNIFTDEFGKGNIPEYIRFIGVDTDAFVAVDTDDPSAGLSPEKFFYITYGATTPQEYYLSQMENRTGKCDWYTNNLNLLPGQRFGAASNRSNARFLLEMNSYQLMSYIRHVLSDIMNTAQYEFGIGDVDVRFVASLAGGTGSGMLIPLAMMVSQYGNVNIYGYSLLHGILRKYDFADRVITNAFKNSYATMLELDYIQHSTEERPFQMKVCDIEFTIKEPLFKEFYMVESSDGAHRVVNEHEDLLKMLAQSMYSASFECEFKPTIREAIKSGIFNVENKIGWLCSLGGCEITYQGEAAAKLQSYADSRKIIAKLLGNVDEYIGQSLGLVCSGIFGIDKPAYWDNLRRELYLPIDLGAMGYRFASSRMENIRAKIKIAKEPIDLRGKSSRIKLNVDPGFGFARLVEVLAALESKLPSILEDLQKQKLSIRNTLEESLMQIEETFVSLAGFKGFVLSCVPEKKESRLNELESRVMEAIELQQELAMREYVSGKIMQMGVEVAAYKAKFQMAHSQMQAVDRLLENNMDELLHKLRKDHSSVRFDTTYAYWKYKQALAEEVDVPYEFETSLFECENMGVSEIADELLKVTGNTPASQHYRELIIADVIGSLPEIHRDSLARFLTASAKGMLALDRRGHMPIEQVQNGILTMFSNKQIPHLFESAIDVHMNYLSTGGFKDRILLTYYEGAVLPYYIKAFTPEMIAIEYEDEREIRRYNPHIDAHLYEIIRDSNYTLAPALPDLGYIKPTVSAMVSTPRPELQPSREPEMEAEPTPVPIEQEKKKYKVFISSKSADYEYAEQVYDFLVEHNMSVFLACRELRRIGEAEYALAMDEALDESEHMIVILSSPDHAKSKWVQYEWSTFENDKKSGYRDGNLLVIKFSDVDQKKLPPALRHKETFFFDSYKDSLLYYLR